FPVYLDTCCLTVLSVVDGSTKVEQWRSTYFGTDNIIGGIALVDFNNDGINEVLVAHKNAPMELLNGEDGSKIAESDSSYEVDHFAFGDVDGDGEGEIVIGNGNILRVFEVDFTTDVPEEEKDLSLRNFIFLSQNYPNPFNYTTLIHFKVNSSQLTVHGPVPTTLKIYNILGQKVKTLLDEGKIPGDYQAIWDGKDNEGNLVPSGIYFYQLTVGKYSESKKMLFLK
ncbi:MAG: T9SS type A sorting domain-containing protein, partial [Candidatus Zixiibacteriota bacterium]